MTMTGTVEPSERFNIRDGQRPVTFVGWQIATANSQSGSDVRWTELTLYRTLTGKYVLEKVGRSDVFHSDDCKRRSKGMRYDRLEDSLGPEDDDEELDDLFVRCTDCKPSFDVEPAWVERDIFSAAVHATAAVLIESLYRSDQNDMRYLSRVARVLLDQAATHDDAIARVLHAPADVT